MTPEINNFMAALPRLLPTFTPAQGSDPVAKAGPGDTGNMLQQLLGQGQQQQSGMFSPELLARLLGPENPDVVGNANKTSNLANGTGGNPWTSGFFKPMDQAFADTGVRTGPAQPQPQLNPGVLPPPVAAGPQAQPNQPLIPGRKPGFAFGASAMPRF